MKLLNLLPILIGLLAFSSAKAQTTGKPHVYVADSVFTFGDIPQGKAVTKTVSIKNTGESPLLLHHVLTTCGCTALDWPQSPILPGKNASMKITFDSAGKSGRQNKVVRIVSNADNGSYIIRFTANIVPAKNKE
ncbi:hypothetical protein FUAX_22970 [Fulvitalea axinellae]|uniref:DUF1573 domain-containing protein n=1 Tax=Fulvitalea axinellae TaxID=1182444 RepID=A0AAU9DFU6_9BACT|nr:hypothetical protein FUAX_22970 [Fulvitalea axinellae]